MEGYFAVGFLPGHDFLFEILKQSQNLGGALTLVVDPPGGLNTVIPELLEFYGCLAQLAGDGPDFLSQGWVLGLDFIDDFGGWSDSLWDLAPGCENERV